MNDSLPKPLTISPRPTCISKGIDEFMIKKINLEEDEDKPRPSLNFV